MSSGMSRVLVTGGAGFIGSHTCDLLLANQFEVRVLDSLQARIHPRGLPKYMHREVEFQQGDVRDRTALERALEGVRYVYHLAAYQDYMPDFHRFLDVNATSTALLYEIIVDRHLPVEKVIVASSQSVYGEGKYECARHGALYPGPRPIEQLERSEWEHPCPICGAELQPAPFDEAVVKPHTAYGISKYAAEQLAVQLGRRYGIPSVALRYSIVQGPRNSPHNSYSGVCRTFTQRALHGKRPVVYEDGRQLRDYVHIQDVAAANLLVLLMKEADGQSFNVGGQRAATVLECASLVAAACSQKLEPILRGDFRVGDTRHTVSDSMRLRRLGWIPRHSLEDIVRDYVEWMRQQDEVPDNSDQAAKEMQLNGVLRPGAVPA